MEQFLTLRGAEQDVSESTVSQINNKPVIVLEDFGIEKRFDISGNKAIEEIIVRKDQSIFEKQLMEIRNLNINSLIPKELTEKGIEEALNNNTHKLKLRKSEQQKAQVTRKYPNRLTNRAIINTLSGNPLSSPSSATDPKEVGSVQRQNTFSTIKVETPREAEKKNIFGEISSPRKKLKGLVDLEPILRLTEFNPERKYEIKNLQKPRRNVQKIANQEKNKIDFELLMELPVDEETDEFKAKMQRGLSKSQIFIFNLESEQLKKLLKKHEPELGRPWFTIKKEKKGKKKQEKDDTTKLTKQTLQPSNNGLDSEGLAINYYGDLSPLARKITGFDGLDRRVLNQIKNSYYYNEVNNDLHGYVSMMYLNIVLGRYPAYKASKKMKFLDQPAKGDKGILNLGIINEDTDQLNLSDVSISDQESLEIIDSADDRTLATPNYGEFGGGGSLENQDEQYSEDGSSLQRSKEEQNTLKPIPPEIFAKEFRKAQEQDGRNKTAIIGRNSVLSLRRAAHQYDPYSEEGMVPYYPYDSRRANTFIEKRNERSKAQDLDSSPTSAQHTVVTKPYGDDTTTEVTEENEFIMSRVPTDQHSRNVSSSGTPPPLPAPIISNGVPSQSAFAKPEKIAPKRETKSHVTFDEKNLIISLDAKLEIAVIPHIQTAHSLLEKIKELVPSDTRGGENVYQVLKDQYQARLATCMNLIISALDRAGQSRAIGLEHIVKICMIGQQLMDPKVKTELLSRVIREYRKNIEIRNREVKQTIKEKRKQRKVLMKTIKAAVGSNLIQGNKKLRNDLAQLERLNTIKRTASSQAQDMEFMNQDTYFRTETDSIERLRQQINLVDSVSDPHQHLKTEKFSAQTSPRYFEESLEMLEREVLKQKKKSSGIQSRHTNSVTSEKNSTYRSKKNSTAEQDEARQRKERQKAYAAEVKASMTERAKPKKNKSVLDDKIVTVQGAKKSNKSSSESKRVVSYISNKMVVSKKKLEKMMSPIADNEEEDEGWMGVDIDF